MQASVHLTDGAGVVPLSGMADLSRSAASAY